MLPEYFAVVGSVIASTGGIYYAYLTLKGQVQPNRVTWFFWAGFPMIAFVAQLSQGVGLVAWATFVARAPPILVLIGSLFNKDAYWQTRPTTAKYSGSILCHLLPSLSANCAAKRIHKSGCACG